MRRLTRLTGAVALIGTAALVAPPIASAKIVDGQSIAGVKLGDTTAQVEQVLGPPEKAELSGLFYPAKFGLRLHLTGGHVDAMLSISKKQKTLKGITIGSSRSKMKAAYPQAKCEAGPYGPSSLYCTVKSHYHGKATYTSFLFGTATLTEIEVGYVSVG